MPTNGMTIDSLNTVSSLTAQDEVPVWDKEASGEPTRKITAQNMTNSVKTLGSLVNTTEMNNAIAQSTADVIRTGDVVNSLTSTATNKPLSANMGKTLNDKFKRIQLSDVTIFETESISAGEVKTGSFTITVPSGFSVASITLKASNNYFTTGVSRVGQSWYYTVKNEYTSALSVSLSALILFKENDA